MKVGVDITKRGVISLNVITSDPELTQGTRYQDEYISRFKEGSNSCLFLYVFCLTIDCD